VTPILTDTDLDPTDAVGPGPSSLPDEGHPVRRLLGTSRYLVLLAVVGSFLASATLMVYGVLRAIGIIIELLAHIGEGVLTGEEQGKLLIADTIALIDMFLLGTVLFIVAAGLYQLFVDVRVPLPGWLRITALDDLKSLVTGVIIVALLVAFLGSAVSWTEGDGTEIIGLGLAVAAVVIAANISMRTFARHTSGNRSHRD
jgi:uncharacterized membrane protein YqhA